jgi:hypothetical protein
MRKIYRSLKEGASVPGDWFEGIVADEPPAATTSDDILKRAESPTASPAPSPGPTPAPTPAPSPAPTAAPASGPTPPAPEELEKKLRAAKTKDALDTHAGWIDAYTDEAVRLRLRELYDSLLKKFH